VFYTIVSLWVLATPFSTGSDKPTPSDLISAIETISSDQGKPFSVEVKYEAAEGLPTTLNICWKPNGQFSFLWSESSSGAPVALLTDAGFFVYDVVDGTLLTGSGVVPSFSLSTVEGKLNLKIGFVKKTPDVAPAFHLSLLTFLVVDDLDYELSDSEASATISHTSRSGKSTVVWTFQLADSIHLTHVRIDERTTGKPVFELSRICHGARSEYIRFPQIESLQLPVTEWSSHDKQAGMLDGFLAPLTRAIAGQAAITDPRFRDSPLLSKGVNWSAVKMRANATQKSISDLVGLPLVPLLAADSVMNERQQRDASDSHKDATADD
jgi:hypothetical protein